MHVLANGNYIIHSFIVENFIASLGCLVFLFMMLSSFSMCCGYYNKILNNQINIKNFYNRRYGKILPFFSLLCIIDLIISPNIDSLYEVFANLTLCFGFLPNANIKVIGVGWFLGVVFVFYFVFPFFCYLLTNKISAWCSFVVSLVFNIICTIYFFDNNHVVDCFTPKTSFIYCSPFFLVGGIIYLYRNDFVKESKLIDFTLLLLCIIFSVIFFTIKSDSIFFMIILFSLTLIYSIRLSNKGNNILQNQVTKFLSNISLEIYLSHMLVFRVLEKLNLIHIFDSDSISYFFASIGTLIGTIIFSITVKMLLIKFFDFFSKKINFYITNIKKVKK